MTTAVATKVDLPLRIVMYAERKARLARLPTWSYVAEILNVGSTSAMQFCHEHLQKHGWKKVADQAPPEGVIVLTAEDLGDRPRKLKRVEGEWQDKKGEEMLYSPSWWKELR